MAHFFVIRPGMLTTIQDLGRWGRQDSGVPVAGPMDVYSHRLANRLVGNADERPALEITFMGPELQAHGDIVCAVAGAEFAVSIGNNAVPTHRAFTVPSGSRLRFGARASGARATLAVRGGLDATPVFGSCATSVLSRMGPFGGRSVVPGDILAVAPGAGDSHAGPVGEPLALPAGGARLRVIPGPHQALFRPAALETLQAERFIVTPQSNRMGYRLHGRPLQHVGVADMLSDATPIGSLQVPPSGQPILLMADRQTTGGYPKIATVISADLPLAGQLALGDWIEFVACTREAAIAALREQDARLGGTGR
jgi:antagonist of KipI